MAIEAFLAAQTNTSLEAIRNSLKIDELVSGGTIKEAKSIEDLLVAASLVTNPSRALFDILWDIYNNYERIDSLGIRKKTSLAVGALAVDGSQDTAHVIDMLVEQRNKCESDQCRVIYIEAMANTRTYQAFNSTWKYFEEKCSKLAAASNIDLCVDVLRVLRVYPAEYFADISKLSKKLLRVVFASSSSFNDLRIECFNILVEKFNFLDNESFLENLLISLRAELTKNKDVDFELLFYIQRYILQRADSDPVFRFSSFIIIEYLS